METLAPKFRQLLAPVYTSLPVAALRFSAAIFTANADKIIKLGNEETEDKSPWEVVQSAILSGVLVRCLSVDSWNSRTDECKGLS